MEPLSVDALNDIESIERAESILHDYWNREGIEIEHTASDEAYYSPSRDFIHLPLFEQFKDANEYYSTAFHESVHSTMKESRCNRAEDRKSKLVAFGSNEYSKEELVDEIGSASLMNILGIETKKSFRNSSAYIQNWVSGLKKGRNVIAHNAIKRIAYIVEHIDECPLLTTVWAYVLTYRNHKT